MSSGVNSAVIVCGPTVSELVVNEALPPLAVTTLSVEPPSLNVTVPFTADVSSALKVTDVPSVELPDGDEVTLIFVATGVDSSDSVSSSRSFFSSVLFSVGLTEQDEEGRLVEIKYSVRVFPATAASARLPSAQIFF